MSQETGIRHRCPGRQATRHEGDLSCWRPSGKLQANNNQAHIPRLHPAPDAPAAVPPQHLHQLSYWLPTGKVQAGIPNVLFIRASHNAPPEHGTSRVTPPLCARSPRSRQALELPGVSVMMHMSLPSAAGVRPPSPCPEFPKGRPCTEFGVWGVSFQGSHLGCPPCAPQAASTST